MLVALACAACSAATTKRVTDDDAVTPPAPDAAVASPPPAADARAADLRPEPAPDAAAVRIDGAPDAAPPRDAAPATTGDGPKVRGGVDGFRWELPCKDATFVTADACYWDLSRWDGTSTTKTGLMTSTVRTFPGRPDTVYTVTFRFRGFMEANTITGPTTDTNTPTPHFYVGGTATGPHNTYGFRVSDPPQSYWVNAHIFLIEPKAIDYTATVMIRGGAAVTFVMSDGNDQLFANKSKVVVPGILPAPEPFNGQFGQLDIVSVTPPLP
jgi:hypothetical protein